jgi:outer membrane protein
LKTRFVKYLIIAAAIFSLGNITDIKAQLKIGYVDSEVILKQLPESQRVQADLEILQKQYVDSIQTRENEIKFKAENFKNRYEDAQKKVESGAVKTDSELKALNDEIAGLQNEIQNLSEQLDVYRQYAQNMILQRQSEMFKPIRDKVTKAIDDIAKSMKINFVFDKADGTLLYGDKEFDLTFKVLDKLK